MMPQLGETVTEGTITRWMKAVGDAVERDEPLFEVSTDKVDSEVPSPAAGVLSEILVPEGETVEVGVKLAVIGDGAGGGPVHGRACGGGRAGARAGSCTRRRTPTTPTPRAGSRGSTCTGTRGSARTGARTCPRTGCLHAAPAAAARRATGTASGPTSCRRWCASSWPRTASARPR